jgi:hypothetical protein
MLAELDVLNAAISAARAHLAAAREQHRRHPDAGYSTETVVATAILVALAIGVLGAIAAKVINKANSINLG